MVEAQDAHRCLVTGNRVGGNVDGSIFARYRATRSSSRAVYLDHNLERIFAGRPTAKPSAEHKRELASMIHLCGAGAAKAFAQRGFRLVTGERCGEHDVATYLTRVKAMEGEFLRLTASP
jgi:hypothetical protein